MFSILSQPTDRVRAVGPVSDFPYQLSGPRIHMRLTVAGSVRAFNDSQLYRVSAQQRSQQDSSQQRGGSNSSHSKDISNPGTHQRSRPKHSKLSSPVRIEHAAARDSVEDHERENFENSAAAI